MNQAPDSSPLQAALHHMSSDGHDPGALRQLCQKHPGLLDVVKNDKPILLGTVIHEVGRSLTTGPRHVQLAESLRALLSAGALKRPCAQGPDWLMLALHPTFGDEGASPRLLMQAGLPVTDEHLHVAGAKGCWSIIPDLIAAGANPANVPGLLGIALQESSHVGWRDAAHAACVLAQDGRAPLEVFPPQMAMANHWTPTVHKPSALLCWDLLISAGTPFVEAPEQRVKLFHRLWPRIETLGTPVARTHTVLRQMVVSAFGITNGNWAQAGDSRSHDVLRIVTPVWNALCERFSHAQLCEWIAPGPSGRSVLIEAMHQCQKGAPAPLVWRAWVDNLQALGVGVSERDSSLDKGVAELLVDTYGVKLLQDPRWAQALAGVGLDWNSPDKTGNTAAQQLADKYTSAHTDKKLSYAQSLAVVREFVLSTQLSSVPPTTTPRPRM